VNPADVPPELTVTFAGTLTAALLLDSETTALPDAALFRLTVQLDVPPLATVDGVQLTELTSAAAGAVTDTVVCAVPLYVAVIVAVWPEVTVSAVAVKPADVPPELTVTFAGTLTAALLLDNETTALPDAALFRFTVQLEVPPLATVDGEQLTELIVAAAGASAVNEVDTETLLAVA
jgi:hypothetical protein